MDQAATLTAGQVAQGRYHAYSLFCQLYLEGVKAEYLPYIQAVPELFRFVGGNVDLDQAGAEHQHLFGFNLFPFESMFLETTGLLGGQATQSVYRSFQEAGYHPDTTSSSPDHIGHEIGLLAHLCQLEAGHWQAGQVSKAKARQAQQLRFMHGHLLRWLIPLTCAVKQQSAPFYVALSDLTWALASSHYLNLIECTLPPDLKPDLGLPALPTLLEGEQTGLREIANYLLTPAYSGVFLSSENITALARDEELPRGFGGRQQMLVNLMRAAAQYQMLPDLLNDLTALVNRWLMAYQDIDRHAPALSPFAVPWQQRSRETISLLQQMKLHSSLN